MKEIRAIIFDIGGVMIKEDNMRTHYVPLIMSMGLSEDDFFAEYKKYIAKASRGKMTGKQMIYLIAQDLKVSKKKLLKNWVKYKRISIKKNKELEDYIKEIKEKGYVVGSMSGVLDLHYKLCEEKGIYDIFDFNIFSFNVGFNKPDIQIYRILLKKLKLPPKEIIFIDDTKECLPPAKKLGIKTILFKNNKRLKRELGKRLK
jgi:putative hydrolase of the HAD superfamily